MKTTVIANPRAKAGEVGRSWERYKAAIESSFGPIDVKLTERQGHAKSLVQSARQTGAERIVVVGGDGTFNEAVNGLVDPSTGELSTELPKLALLPCGTASDLARAIRMPELSPRMRLDRCTYRPVDLGRVELCGPNNETNTHYFINEASIGASAQIVHRVNRASKKIGGKAAFALGTLRGLASWRDQRVRIRVDDQVDETLRITLVALANGRYFGGGMMIAPDAISDDGLLDVVVVKGAGVLKFIQHSQKLYKGAHLNVPLFSFYQGRTVRIDPADEPRSVLVETDGENPGILPATFTVLPKAIDLMAPWSEAEAVAR